MPEQKNIFSYKPQINLSIPSTGRMWLVCSCAFLCVIQSALSDGGRSLIVCFTALISALLLELLLTYRNYGVSKIKDGSAAVAAMVFSLMLPNQIHPLYVFFGISFAIVVVKYSFGGLGSNWLNPALGGWLFIRFSWPAGFEKALEGIDISVTRMNTTSDLIPLDGTVTEFLNSSVFSISGVQMPSGYIDLLFFNGQGIIADRGLFCLLIGTIIITAAGINRGWIPLVFLAVYGFLVRFTGDLSGLYWNGDILYAFFSGGTIAAAFIIAAEPSSSAKLKSGIFLAVVIGAVLSWFFRYVCLEYYSCFTALAVINCITPLVKLIEERFLLSHNNRKKFQENIL